MDADEETQIMLDDLKSFNREKLLTDFMPEPVRPWFNGTDGYRLIIKEVIYSSLLTFVENEGSRRISIIIETPPPL
jgi:hypothetical protein